MTIKIDFEFKQGDYVELAGMSEEQVEAVFNKMCKDGMVSDDTMDDYKPYTLGLAWTEDDQDGFFQIYGYKDHEEDYCGKTRRLTVKDIFPTLEETDIDMENCKSSLEESLNEFSLQDVRTWRCFEEVSGTLGSEDAEYELGKVLLQINDGEITSNACGFSDGLDLESDDLDAAFNWEEAVQGFEFWEAICEGVKPEGYDSTPDTPPTPEVDKKATPALKELMKLNKDNVEGTIEVRSQTLGELVEAIQANIPPQLGIHFQPDGEVLLECDNAYVVVSELDSEGVDKAIEFVAHYGHLVIGKNDLQG